MTTTGFAALMPAVACGSEEVVFGPSVVMDANEDDYDHEDDPDPYKHLRPARFGGVGRILRL